MRSISAGQQLIIIIAVSVVFILIMICVVRGKSKTDLRRPMKFLTWGFVATTAALVYAIIDLEYKVYVYLSAPAGVYLLWAVVLVWVAAGLTFLIALGTLASRLERSAFGWIGLTVLTKPYGPFVAYFWMRSLVRKAVAQERGAPAQEDAGAG